MPEPGAKKGRLIAALAVASGLTPLNSTMLSVALEPIGVAFRSSEAQLTLVLVTSYLVTSIVMQAPGGKLGDLLGHRRALALGQLGFACASLLGWFSPSLAALVVARTMMAAAGALIVPSAVALLRTELPPTMRGRAFGVFGANMALSAALGPLLGGQIAAAFGWRALFAVNVLLVPLSAWLAGRAPAGLATPTSSPRARVRFDLAGSGLLGLGLAALVIGTGRGDRVEPVWLGVCPAALAAFVLVERRHPSPVVDLSLLGRRVFMAGSGVIALQNLAMYALLFELPAICSRVLHAGPRQTGPLLVAFMAPVVLLSPIAGRLTDAIGARLVATLGALVASAGTGLLIGTKLDSLGALVPGLVIFGVGLALCGSPAQSSSMSDVPADRSGVAAGMMATMRYLGGIAGTLALGVLLSGHSDGPSAALAAHRAALGLFTAALLGSSVCAALLPGRPATA